MLTAQRIILVDQAMLAGLWESGTEPWMTLKPGHIPGGNGRNLQEECT